ncbi:hypothetical protein M7I_6279 [Glarea lozoyensis 74030]|uniref:Uncharacterized protein n=1 Tax=Glarea lozoyensis (strain ATCC 74030 / MF5533) TaxID=1104152 RepID=H0EU50_GLAL7|nr:hypothetical protein M7I_6279 [Glarea lozoyensis 74030]
MQSAQTGPCPFSPSPPLAAGVFRFGLTIFDVTVFEI